MLYIYLVFKKIKKNKLNYLFKNLKLKKYLYKLKKIKLSFRRSNAYKEAIHRWLFSQIIKILEPYIYYLVRRRICRTMLSI